MASKRPVRSCFTLAGFEASTCYKTMGNSKSTVGLQVKLSIVG
jgi:hypothetical protein